jgi:hypothetical protein
MSIQSLQCELKKLSTIAQANAAARILSLKNSIIAQKNAAVAAAITTANAIIDPILANASAVVDQTVAAARSAITSATDSVQVVQARLRKLLDTTPELCTILPPTYIPTKPTTNVTATVLALPSTNATQTGEAKNKQQLENAKSTGINDQITATGKVNKELSSKGVSEMREYVRLLKNHGPQIDAYTANLSYFQPTSDYVGSSFLAYTPDKTSLYLEDWKSTKPKAVRQNILHKLPPTTLSAIEENYQKINTRFFSNISNEFLVERRPGINLTHGYHIMGDAMWINNHVDTAAPLIKSIALKLPTANTPIGLIEYLTPIDETLTVENNFYDIDVEGKPTVIDLKGNVLREPELTVNNSVLKPVEPAES